MQNKLDQAVLEFRKGKPEAYKQLHDVLYRSVYYFAFRLIGKKDEADDIVEEVFVKMWTLRRNFDTYSNVKAFLFLATKNTCRNFIEAQTRKAARKKAYHYQLNSQEPPLYLHEKIEEEIIRSEVLEHFYKELEKLPRQMRIILYLRVKKNLTYAVIADRLQTTRKNVANQLSDARKRLGKNHDLLKRWMFLKIAMTN